ncbi:MAG: hypothetical protein WAZ77_23090 [Candidatus Nitrosopolaris sp.]
MIAGIADGATIRAAPIPIKDNNHSRFFRFSGCKYIITVVGVVCGAIQ